MSFLKYLAVVIYNIIEEHHSCGTKNLEFMFISIEHYSGLVFCYKLNLPLFSDSCFGVLRVFVFESLWFLVLHSWLMDTAKNMSGH